MPDISIWNNVTFVFEGITNLLVNNPYERIEVRKKN